MIPLLAQDIAQTFYFLKRRNERERRIGVDLAVPRQIWLGFATRLTSCLAAGGAIHKQEHREFRVGPYDDSLRS